MWTFRFSTSTEFQEEETSIQNIRRDAPENDAQGTDFKTLFYLKISSTVMENVMMKFSMRRKMIFYAFEGVYSAKMFYVSLFPYKFVGIFGPKALFPKSLRTLFP